MPNLALTQEQKKLLKWMSVGHTFKVCSDYGPKQWDIIPSKRLPIRLFQTTVQKLYQHGLISFEPIYYFGQRWDEFSLTEKGKAAL
ncbi:hypothetical protein GT360_12450 [Vibrio astriarenae]|uniref:Uncharacterized protein n=1 Tax=Vibrio astriarenae TaxID=1481923 RepID=A0A7Z2T4J8_9VIBR|nr:hypothetical protein [Vibrio astriarenae]QIA64269.1 hypothetical protein GT360_12450 [Vibrio astriarenae]